MSPTDRFSLVDLICNLREALVLAREEEDWPHLEELKTTFTTLREKSYGSKDEKIIGLMTTLEDSARDGLMRVPWKSEIPSVSQIRAMLAEES